MLPWNAQDLSFDENRFRGIVRLFPLPDLVMFPHVVQPLHIFEQRYRDLLHQALDSDGLIAMSVLDPHLLRDEEKRPKLAPYACLGKVVTHQRLEDGRYNLMLLGQRRIRIVEELPQRSAFREARVEVLEDCQPTLSEIQSAALQAKLTEAFREALPAGSLASGSAASEPISELLAEEIPLGVLTDLVSFALDLPCDLKLAMLSESNIEVRAKQLLAELTGCGQFEPSTESIADSSTQLDQADFFKKACQDVAAVRLANGFPPPFSSN
ncbi:LON peptidase substrate-binding domain-containing protein [Adhaeretor mobilis]|uniref:Lon protease 2 n=1 Tax=Adhaeretor mobilis TaxID=1930276 RepID=A0A517MUL0_9BACT|nr:LON peptidase substrate-binding domain-containing protein [Adhaeretor mobilis]QDS98560.1 Lon protease 2 [Adhaeretor mobilis]